MLYFTRSQSTKLSCQKNNQKYEKNRESPRNVRVACRRWMRYTGSGENHLKPDEKRRAVVPHGEDDEHGDQGWKDEHSHQDG